MKDGPGKNKLLNGDEILCINGEDVQFASREYVINLIRQSFDTLKLIVKQPTVGGIFLFSFAKIFYYHKLFVKKSSYQTKCTVNNYSP